MFIVITHNHKITDWLKMEKRNNPTKPPKVRGLGKVPQPHTRLDSLIRAASAALATPTASTVSAASADSADSTVSAVSADLATPAVSSKVDKPKIKEVVYKFCKVVRRVKKTLILYKKRHQFYIPFIAYTTISWYVSQPSSRVLQVSSEDFQVSSQNPQVSGQGVKLIAYGKNGNTREYSPIYIWVTPDTDANRKLIDFLR